MESFGKRGQTGKGAVLRAGISSGSPIFKRASGAACGSIFTDLCAEKQRICDYLAGVLRNGAFRDKFVERRLFTGGGDAGSGHASGARRAGNYGARVSERVCTDFHRRDVTCVDDRQQGGVVLCADGGRACNRALEDGA